MEKTLVLRDCKAFDDFKDDELVEIAAISKLVHFERGHDVFAIEHGDNYIFVVADGKLVLRLYNNVSKVYSERDLFGEICLFNDRGRLGTIHCVEEVTLLAIDRRKILAEAEGISLATRFKLLRAMGTKMANYFYPDTHRSTQELILEDESEYLEFKVSVDSKNWNKIVRTIAGFMNLNGGTIIVGINDETGEVSDFQPTRKQRDNFERIIRQLVNQHLGELVPTISFSWEPIDEKRQVIRIDVEPSNSPIIYRETDKKEGKYNELFIVRSGNENRYIKHTSRIIEYIQRRFKSNA